MKLNQLLYPLSGITICSAFFLAGKHTSNPPTNDSEAVSQSREIAISSRSPIDQSRRLGSQVTARTDSLQANLKIGEILEIQDPAARTRAILAWIEQLSLEEMPEALAHFRATGLTSKNSPAYDLLLQQWAKTDPLGALQNVSNKDGFRSAGKTILATWVRHDPQAALQWAKENSTSEGNPEKANKWMEGIVEGLALVDQNMATELLDAMPQSKAKREAIESMLRELSKIDLDTSKSWVSSLPKGDFQSEAIEQLAQQIARNSPQDALAWAQSLGPESLASAAKPIVENWAREDLNEAKSWAEEQSGELLAEAAPALIKEMLQNNDFAGASEWLAPHDGDPRFNDAIEQLVRQADRESPALAADWAGRHTDPIKQEKILNNLFEKWHKHDPAAAQEYLQNNPVPGSVQKHFPTIIPQNMGGETASGN